MDTKEIIIKVPEGYEIDQENSTFGCIKFKPIKTKLPRTWEEFCETHPRVVGEWYLSGSSQVYRLRTSDGLARDPDSDKNILPSRELAEAVLALCQLIQLRDCYNDGWKPNWYDNKDYKYCIDFFQDKIHATYFCAEQKVLAFRTEELRDKFLVNFQDLIEIAKPLL